MGGRVMAGDWIKMRADLFTHPKVFKISEILSKDELYTVGALFCFWAWADKHCVDGLVDGATSRLIDRATRVDGLSNALIAVGWLEIDDLGAHIPRFGEHNGDTAKERSLKNQRQARWRAGKTAGNVDGYASTQPTTNASTREEKRREEISPSLRSGEKASPNGSRLPADWSMPDEWAEFCKTERPDLIPSEVACRFADYWHGVAGAKGRKADWLATWRNWVRAEKKTPVGASGGLETAYQRSMRERMQEAAPEFARKAPGKPAENVVEFFVVEAATKRLEIGNEPSSALG
jgi:hypothetical protein